MLKVGKNTLFNIILLLPLAQRGGREAATHLVYKYLQKVRICVESPNNNSTLLVLRSTIRTTVLIRPLQFRYAQLLPLRYAKKGQHRKFNVFDDI